MKKLKTAFCAIIGATLLATPCLAYNAPEYNLEGAKKKVEYQMSGSVRITKHAVDRNKDGNTDLIEEKIIYEEKKIVNLYIDDDFDSYTDRILSNKKNGDYGTEVKISDIKIEDFF